VTQPLVVATALLAHGLLGARVDLPVTLVGRAIPSVSWPPPPSRAS
jgi:hypothetical protein